MIHARSELHIAAPPEAVFDFSPTPAPQRAEVAPRRQDRHHAVGRPIRLHTRFEGEYARAGTVLLELVEFDPPHRVTFRARAKTVEFDDQVELTPAGDGTLLVAEMAAQPRGVMRLFAPMVAKTMRRQFAQNWPCLKRVLED